MDTGGAGSCFARRRSSSSEIRWEMGRARLGDDEFFRSVLSSNTSRDIGRPLRVWSGCAAGDAEDDFGLGLSNSSPPSFVQLRPDSGPFDVSSNCKPFSRSQAKPPVPLGAHRFSSFCISSSSISSASACEIARSLASSSSAFVRKPFLEASDESWPASLVPDAHPLVMVFRRVAASAITFRISTPRRVGFPPSLWPDPLLRDRRFSAAIRA